MPQVLGRRDGQTTFERQPEVYGFTPPVQQTPRNKRLGYKGGFYTDTIDPRGRFPVDVSVTIDLKTIVDAATPQGSLAQAVFLGHFPDCEFDELVARMQTQDGTYTDPFDYDDSKRAELSVFEITGQGIERDAIREISGIESFVFAKNGAVFRERLRVPYRTQTLWSVTMGGPITPRAPLFLLVVPQNISSMEATGWKIIVNLRVMMQPLI